MTSDVRAAPDDGLWHCPRCGYGFVSANMSHSCVRMTVDETLARTTPEARAAFRAFVALVERCGPVVVVPQKTRIVLMTKTRFAGVSAIRRDSIRLTFAIGRRLDLPALLCESYRDNGERASLSR